MKNVASGLYLEAPVEMRDRRYNDGAQNFQDEKYDGYEQYWQLERDSDGFIKL